MTFNDFKDEVLLFSCNDTHVCLRTNEICKLNELLMSFEIKKERCVGSLCLFVSEGRGFGGKKALLLDRTLKSELSAGTTGTIKTLV